MPFHDLGKKLDKRFDRMDDKIEIIQDKIKKLQEEDKKPEEDYSDEEVIDAVNDLWQ